MPVTKTVSAAKAMFRAQPHSDHLANVSDVGPVPAAKNARLERPFRVGTGR